MSRLVLVPLASAEDRRVFISEIQEAFQGSYEEAFGRFEKKVLPADDIEESLSACGSEAYRAEMDGECVGGTVIAADRESGRCSLHLLYVKKGAQNAGIGYKIWQALEALHPETRIWETHTPYFDKRNIHFYVNRCGFKIVEFFNPKHRDPHHESAGNIPPENNYFFRFEKDRRELRA